MTPPASYPRLILILGSMAMIGPLAIDTYLPSFPTMAQALHASPGAMQWSIGVYFIGLAFGQAIYGPLSDRIGRKLPVYAGLVLFIAGALGCALALDATHLIAWRFVQALGGCAQMVVARAIVRDCFDGRDAARFFSMIMLVNGIAPIIGPLLGGFLLIHFGWQSVFVFLAGYGLVSLLAVSLALPETLPIERRAQHGVVEVWRNFVQLLTDREFVARSLTGGLYSASMFAYLAGSPFVFMEIYHVRPENFGFFFGSNAIGLVIASQINRLLLHRFGMEAILRVVLSVTVVAAMLVALQTFTGWGGFPALLLPLFVCVAAIGFVGPNATALALAPHGRIAGNASAVYGIAQFAAGGLVGMAVGSLNDGTARPMGAFILLCGGGAFLVNRLSGAPRVA